MNIKTYLIAPLMLATLAYGCAKHEVQAVNIDAKVKIDPKIAREQQIEELVLEH